jgi:hypothetical protein
MASPVFSLVNLQLDPAGALIPEGTQYGDVSFIFELLQRASVEANYKGLAVRASTCSNDEY